jgi:hypothetical protein
MELFMETAILATQWHRGGQPLRVLALRVLPRYILFQGDAMRTADEILEEANNLSPAERRQVAEELLEELDRSLADDAQQGKGPYGRWLDAAGSVRPEFSDLSTDKYKHVAAASLHGHDEA